MFVILADLIFVPILVRIFVESPRIETKMKTKMKTKNRILSLFGPSSSRK